MNPRLCMVALFAALLASLPARTLMALDAAPRPAIPSDLVATIDGEAIHLNELVLGPLVLNDISAHPHLADNVLTFSDCQAACYGGELRGTIALDLAANRTHVIVAVAGVDLAGLLASLGSTNDGYSGKVTGHVDLSFPTNDIRAAEGRGQASISDGNLVEMSILTNLLVGDVTNTRGQDSAEVTFAVRQPDEAQGAAGNLVARASEINLTSARVTMPKGSVLISGSVSLDGALRLLVVPRVAGGLISQVWLVGKWFGAALSIASGRVARVVVRGTLSRPVIVLNPFANE